MDETSEEVRRLQRGEENQGRRWGRVEDREKGEVERE